MRIAPKAAGKAKLSSVEFAAARAAECPVRVKSAQFQRDFNAKCFGM